jgi:hypothetical protein
MSGADQSCSESGPATPIRPTYRIHGGMRMPLGFPPEGFASGLAYRPDDDDIFVASYPKSGTTWLQYIVFLLIRGCPLSADESLTDHFPHLEEVGADAVASQPRPRLIKTHLPFGMTPYSPGARYLVIARNPFDCAVSFYHHTRGFPRHYAFAEGRFEEFFDCFVKGEVDFGGYFDHLISWHAALRRGNVRLVTYEALKADAAAVIRQIAAFLGEAAAAAVASEASLAAVVEESGFSAMRRDQQRWSSRRPDWAPAFVRKGVVGDWRRLFTPGQAARLLAEFDRRLEGTGLESLWPEVLAEARAFARTE